MTYKLVNATDFFAYARERQQIKIKRDEGRSWPWTSDPVLQKFRFCNVFREDDTVTKWVRSHIHMSAYGSHILGAMIIARWFNRVETLEQMLQPTGVNNLQYDLLFNWGEIEGWAAAMRERLSATKPLVTGAYMIKTPAGMNKLEGLIWCLRRVLPATPGLVARMNHMAEIGNPWPLETLHAQLKGYPYLGDFMAYEVVTDMRHTPLLLEAPDINTWASPGPGAARGMARVLGLDIKAFKYSQDRDRVHLIACMRELLELSRLEDYWPKCWGQWEMREVEHTLCEFDKYERARLGEGQPKQLYRRG